ncbi:hypothetical protein ACWEQ8_21170, partial [Streptomyces noursei]
MVVSPFRPRGPIRPERARYHQRDRVGPVWGGPRPGACGAAGPPSALAEVCAEDQLCRFDRSVFDYRFTGQQLSTWD